GKYFRLALPLLLSDGICKTSRLDANRTERSTGKEGEPQETCQHADARDAKPPAEPDLFPEQTGKALSCRPAAAAPHIKNRESSTTPCSSLGIEVADDGGDIRLQETRAENDQDETDEERCPRPHKGRQSDRQVTARDQHRADLDRSSQTKPPVR